MNARNGVLGTLTVIACLWAGGALAVGQVELVSRGAFPAPMPSDSDSFEPRASADGRFLVFSSAASTFGIVDGNATFDVYLYDRQLGQFSLLSRSGGSPGDLASLNPDISADGNIVAFVSQATNLAPPAFTDRVDPFVLNRGTGVLRRLLPAPGVGPNGDSSQVQVSADGRYVAFVSVATNWVAGDTNAAEDLFVYDTVTGTVERASVGDNEEENNTLIDNGFNFEIQYSLSDNGRCVAFTSPSGGLVSGDTNNVQDVFVRDLDADTTLRVSVGPLGQEGTADSGSPRFTAGCSRIAFATFATNLHPDGVVNYFRGVFEKNLADASVTRIWPAFAAPNLQEAANRLVASRNGEFVGISGNHNVRSVPAPRMTIWRRTGDLLVQTPAGVGGSAAAIPDGGAFFYFESHDPQPPYADLNASDDVYLYDLQFGGDPIQVTVPPSPRIASSGNGASGVGNFGSPLITSGSTRNQFVSDDGLLIAYSSIATNLVIGDSNNIEDVFLRDRRTGTNARLTRTPAGGQANGDSTVTDMTADGRFVMIDSCASNLVAGDTNNACDVFVLDRAAPPATAVERVNVDSNEAQSVGDFGNNPTTNVTIGGHWSSISADGRYVAYASRAADLVAGDTNNRPDIFLRDRQTGTTIRLTPNTSGGRPVLPRISADGRFVAFRANVPNLVPGVVGTHAYVVDTTSLAIEIVSVDSGEVVTTDAQPSGLAGADRSFISEDGRYVAFVGFGDDLVPGDTNDMTDVFIRDRLLGKTTRASLQPDGTQWPNLGFESTGIFIGGLSSRGLLVPFCVDTDGSICNSAYSYNIGTGKVDQLYPTPSGNSQSLRLFASPNGKYVALSQDAVLTPSDENGKVRDIYVASGFTSTGLGGTEGAAPADALSGAPEADARMGTSVAASEDFVVIGAPGTNEVYIYAKSVVVGAKRMTGGATQGKALAGSTDLLATLFAPGGIPGDEWGAAVSITPDGNTIAVGAPGAGPGQVFVFKKPEFAPWANLPPDTVINAPAPTGSSVPDKFGSAVALAEDGRLIVGAPETDVAGQSDAGMVAVYNPQAGSYPQTPNNSFQAPAPESGAAFGTSVAATATGAAIGAPMQDAGMDANVGAVYTYSSTGGAPYQPQGTLAPPYIAKPNDQWGLGMGMSGTTLVVGAPGADTAAGIDSGTGYVYDPPDGNFTAATPIELKPSLPGPGDGAGKSVQVVGDYISLGAPGTTRQNVGGTGTAFVFEKPESGWRSRPVHTATVELRPSEAQSDQAFGDALALTSQGIIAGVPERDIGVRPDQGEADTFAFDRILRGGFE